MTTTIRCRQYDRFGENNSVVNPLADRLARAADDGRTLTTENAADFLPLLDQRQSAGLTMTAVLIALGAGRGKGGVLYSRLASAIAAWADGHPKPYAHAHSLP